LLIAIQFVLAVLVERTYTTYIYNKRNDELTRRENAMTDRIENDHVENDGRPPEPEPIFMGRLSADDFIQKMRDAKSWSIRTGYSMATMCREIEVVIPNEDGVKEHFLGPDPIETVDWTYRYFIEALTEITGVSSSVIKFTVNRNERSDD
jgi:hypothetical protein